MVQDAERSSKNFTPEDRFARKMAQKDAAIARLRAQLETQERSLRQLVRTVLQLAPDRLAEIGLTAAEARAFTAQ